MNAPTPAGAPKVALILKIDTLGDLVLFAPTARCLRAAWPHTRFVVLIRRTYLDLAPLVAPDVEWLGTPLDPFAHRPDANPAELTRLRDAIAALQPDVSAAASSRRHWLDVALAAAAPAARRISLGAANDDTFFAAQLHIHLGLRAAEVFRESIVLPPDEPDWQRNFRLADALLGRTVARTAPSLTPDDTTRAVAKKILATHDLAPGRFAVCAAAGFANVKIKTLPADRFGTPLKHL